MTDKEQQEKQANSLRPFRFLNILPPGVLTSDKSG